MKTQAKPAITRWTNGCPVVSIPELNPPNFVIMQGAPMKDTQYIPILAAIFEKTRQLAAQDHTIRTGNQSADLAHSLGVQLAQKGWISTAGLNCTGMAQRTFQKLLAEMNRAGLIERGRNFCEYRSERGIEVIPPDVRKVRRDYLALTEAGHALLEDDHLVA